MRKHFFVWLLGWVLVTANAAAAQQGYTPEPRVDVIKRHLAEQGYTEIEVERTFLGRTRIEAKKNGMEREIILNPRTGEILRDYWEDDDHHKVLGANGSSAKVGEDADDDD